VSDIPKPRPHQVSADHQIPKRFRTKPRWVDLPVGLMPPDLTIDETAAYRRESRWTVHKKLREGVYQSYKDGRLTKVILSSVIADRERAIARSANPTGKRKPGGQPRKKTEAPAPDPAE
jgi:hypothetical protein